MGKGLKVTPVTHTIFNFAFTTNSLIPGSHYFSVLLFIVFNIVFAFIVISIKYGGIVIVYNGFNSWGCHQHVMGVRGKIVHLIANMNTYVLNVSNPSSRVKNMPRSC
jgi:hypothetical protein